MHHTVIHRNSISEPNVYEYFILKALTLSISGSIQFAIIYLRNHDSEYSE